MVIPLNEVQVPRHAIARPVSGSFTSVAEAMGFAQRSREFCAFSAGLREISSKYLDKTVNYREQGSDQWQQFFDEACMRFPFVTQYENAWPLDSYMQSHLERTKYDYNRKLAKAAIGPQSQRRTRQQIKYHLRRKDLDQDNGSHADSELSSTSSGNPQVHTSAINSQLCSQSETNSSSTTSSTSTCCDSLRHVTAKQNSAQAVKDFLKTVQPNLDDLAPKFIQAGVANAECVQALAEMPDSEKNVFLRESLSLNPLQVHAVRIALAKKIGGLV